MGLINEDFKTKLHELRKERNDFIHELYLIEQRNNIVVMKSSVLKVKTAIMQLTQVFEGLVFNEIGVDIPQVLETL